MKMNILIAIVCGCLLVLGMVFFFQHKLLFFPDSQLTATPSDIGLEYEEVVFRSRDGVELHGWYLPAPPETDGPTALFFHGNAGNISHRLEQLRIIHSLGLSCFIFDYRGFGRSRGRMSEQGSYRDAAGAWDYLRREIGLSPTQIVCWGRSMGGPIAARLAGDTQPLALIIESSFPSIPAMAKRLYPFLPVNLLLRYRFPTEQFLQEVACPVLIVHSREDGLVPFDFGRRLYEKAPDPKAFLELQGGHNEGFLISEEVYVQGLEGFLEETASKGSKP